MSNEPSLHDQYYALSFRPMVDGKGNVGMVGVSNLGPCCVAQDVYPNLLMAAPALYQQLHIAKGALVAIEQELAAKLDTRHLLGVIEECEKALTFAQHGYSMPMIDTSQFGKN